MQSITLAVNSVIELIRTFPALMESERPSSSHLRNVFYPETNALSGRLRGSCFHWFQGLISGPFSYGFTKENCMYSLCPPCVLLLLLPSCYFLVPLFRSKHSSQLPVIKPVFLSQDESSCNHCRTKVRVKL